MSLPPLTYLSMDGLTTGIGTSQVTPYVVELARRGLDVTVHSFEQRTPTQDERERFRAAGVTWRPEPFGSFGAKGGLRRTLVAARACRGAELLHARADVSAAAALLARPERWIWDIRSFWREQRIELGMLAVGSPEERVLRLVEGRSARSCSAAITLARAAIPVLAERHGAVMERKARVVPTCVDLDRFPLRPAPDGELVALLSGTLNRYYDVPAMLALVEALRRRRPTELRVLTPGPSAWDDELAAAGGTRYAVPFEAMPAEVAASHLGLSLCRTDLGPSLHAAMPTKIGEFLATGRPIVVSPGIGDLDELVAEWRCGVIVPASGPDAIDAAADALLDLLADPELGARCRAAAEATFDLGAGVDRLLATYTQAVLGD